MQFQMPDMLSNDKDEALSYFVKKKTRQKNNNSRMNTYSEVPQYRDKFILSGPRLS